MQTEFPQPEITQRISERPVPPTEYPYFLIAFWPRDQRWKIFAQTYLLPNGTACLQQIYRLQKNGWTHITILKLPELPAAAPKTVSNSVHDAGVGAVTLKP